MWPTTRIVEPRVAGNSLPCPRHLSAQAAQGTIKTLKTASVAKFWHKWRIEKPWLVHPLVFSRRQFEPGMNFAPFT